MEEVGDVCESEGVCEVMCDLLSEQPEPGESMETVVEEAAAHMTKAATAGEDAGLSAAGHSKECPNTETLKPQYSYRLVLQENIQTGLRCF